MVDFMKNHQIDLLKKFDQILDNGYELRQFILSLAQHFRDLLMVKIQTMKILLSIHQK